MKHFIVAASLYALCGAQSGQGGLGAYYPSYEIVGATSSENNDVHRLTVQLLDKCPDLALLGTSKDCASAPGKIASAIGSTQVEAFYRSSSWIRVGSDSALEDDCANELEELTKYVDTIIKDAPRLRQLGCEPTKLAGLQQRFITSLQKRDTAVQNFVDAYKTRVAKLPSSHKCVGQTIQPSTLSAKLKASDEETQKRFGVGAVAYCLGLNNLV